MSSSPLSPLSQESLPREFQTFHGAGAVIDLTPFPSLTGLRPKTTDGTRICTVKVFDCAFVDLQKFACSSNLSEDVVLQAAWANLLSLYTGSPDVTFLSASSISNTVTERELLVHHFRISDEASAISPAPLILHKPLEKFHHETTAVQHSFRLDEGSFLDLEHLRVDQKLRDPSQEDAAAFGRRCAVCLTIQTVEGGALHAELSSTALHLNHQAASQILDQFEHALFSHIRGDYSPPENIESVHSPSEVFEPLHSQFEKVARTNPDRLAINYVFNLQSQPSESVLWSYTALNQKADAFARHLQQVHNVRNNAIIPICMDRCPELYVAILGILKAGAAWCPIDPSFPARRRSQLVNRTNARIVVVNESSPRDGFSDSVEMIALHRHPAAVRDHAVHWQTPEIGPDDIAYLVWTSGTTGEPKGVPIHHRAAMTSMRALQCAVPAKTRDGKPLRCLQFSHFTFDVFVQDLFYTWGSGGTLICSDRATMLGSFAALANTSGATHAHLTPAFAASVPRANCPTLEVVTMIGEKLTQTVADDWSRDLTLLNTYGPAETTVVSTLRQVPHKDNMQSANVGFPLSSVGAVVMRNHRPVGRNCIGELALAGPQLSKGYWRDPERTQSRFLYNQHLRTNLYMTGDTVRLLFDGSLEFVGRTDDLVKIQGIRIELSEISYALCNFHPMVQQIEIALLDRPDRPSKVLVAFLAVPDLQDEAPRSHGGGAMITAEAADVARAALQEAQATLPEYMIPKIFLIVGQIPRTPSAKIDRARLAQLYADADLGGWEITLSAGQIGRSDWTEAERTIVDIVADLTGTSRSSIRRESALSSIGIDSIAATRLVTDLHARHVRTSLLVVLQCRHFGDLLVACLNQAPEINRDNRLEDLQYELMACVDPVSAENASLIAPCLPLQEALLAETCQAASSYWSNNFFCIGADVDLGTLREAWLSVAMKTDALRLSFLFTEELSRKPSVDAAFLQVFSKDPTIDFVSIETFQSLLEAQAKQRALDIATRWQRVNFKAAPWAITVFSSEHHRLMMLSIHHSICDELSARYLVDDVHRAYHRSELKDRNQFGSALGTLLRERSTKDESFWSNALTDFQDSDEQKIWPSLIRNNKLSSGSITKIWQVKHSYGDLQDRAAKLGASSVVSVLRLIWGFILHEYLETDHVVFGETWSARGEASGHLDVIGPMIYTVPTPFELSGTVREAVKRLDEFHFHARQHLNFHPRDLRRMLGYSRSRILYPAIFNFVLESGSQQVMGGNEWLQTDDMVGLCVEHPIALNATLSSSSRQVLIFELVADHQHMDGEHLEILGHQIDALLDVALCNPDKPLRLLSSYVPIDLLSIAESPDRRVREVQNESPVRWVDYYEEHYPDWPAVEAVSLEDEHLISKKWSYQELRRAYSSVVTVINDFGFQKRLIGVCLEHSLEVHAVILGIMASNNVYLPIAQDLPVERKRFLLQDSNAAMLFTSIRQESFLPGCEVCYVEDLDPSTPAAMADASLQGQAQDGAYLLYTSGSTGAPKGVHVGRGNLVSFIEAISTFICRHVDMTQLQGLGKYLGMASYAFDVHLLEMFFAWRHGMTTVAAPRSILLDDLEAILQKFRITHASFVPSLVDSAGITPSSLPDLRYMSVGGEMITEKVIRNFANSHVVLVNAYGPTEATIGCCFQRVTTEMNIRNIGTPLAYTTAHVLQPESSQHALRNTPGELCLTGALVANGYFHRPDAKGFVDDFNGQKMYRTGDRVRLMANGSLEFLGRKDDQTKIRGQRIELGEVSEGVRSAALAVSPHRSVEVASIVSQHPSLARPQLVAFVSSGTLAGVGTGNEDVAIEKSGSSTVEAIRNHCRANLPAYMVPDHILSLNQLPLANISRKVDMKKLAFLFSELSLETTTPSHRSDVCFSDDQKFVRALVEKTLAFDVKNIKATSNLFSYGLDSLNAIALTVGLQKTDFRCTVSDVLRNPSIERLARLPRSKQQVEQSRSKPVDLRTKLTGVNGWQERDFDILRVRKCLPLQETLVASSLDESEVGMYINHVVLKLSSQIDLEQLIRAWETTVQNQEILRTCFAEIDNHQRLIQVVLRHGALSCCRHVIMAPETALGRLSTERPIIAADILRKLFTDPPLRLNFATSNTACLLQISVHHALYDAQSFNMILSEVQARYLGSETRSFTSIDPLIDYISSQDQSKAKRFWQHYLGNYKPGGGLDRKKSSDKMSVTRKLCLPYSKLEQLAMSFNSTPASVTQAVFGVALAQTLGRADVVFGAVLSGRTVPISGAESIVAPCITTIPQRVTVARDRRLEEIVRNAHHGFVDSLDYQFSALRDIHRWVKADGPLFDSLFTYNKTPESTTERLWQEIESHMSSGFPLAVEVEAGCGNDEVCLRCDALATCGDREDASHFLDRMVSLVQSLSNKEQMTTFTFSDHAPPHDRKIEPSMKEQKLKSIAADLIGRSSDDISSETSFFTLGIDSILAIQFVKRLRQAGITCSTADIMRNASIAKLSQHLTQTKSGVSNARTNPVVESLKKSLAPVLSLTGDIVTKRYYCTPLQSSMLSQTLGSEDQLYVHQHCIRLDANVDRIKLRTAWNSVVKGLEILRTSFHFDQGESTWTAAVHSSVPDQWHLENYNNLNDALSSIRRVFSFHDESDFCRPPWRMDLFQDILILSLHHSLYDGESLGLLFRHLADVYTTGKLDPAPPFSHVANAIRASHEQAENFWLQTLKGFAPVNSRSLRGKLVQITRHLTLDLPWVLASCKERGVTLQAVALLAFGQTLAQDSDSRDVVFGNVVRGRSLAMTFGDVEVDVNDIVGPLFNTTPFRVDSETLGRSHGDAVQKIQNFIVAAQIHQHASLPRVQQAWHEKTRHDEMELIDSLFVFQKGSEGLVSDLPWTIVELPDERDSTEHSLNFEIEQGPGAIVVSANCTRTTNLQQFVENFEMNVHNILAFPDGSIMDKVLEQIEPYPGFTDDSADPQLLNQLRDALSRASQVPATDISDQTSIKSLGLDSISAIKMVSCSRKQGLKITVMDVIQGRNLLGIAARVSQRCAQRHAEQQSPVDILSEQERQTVLITSGIRVEDVDEITPCLAGQDYHLRRWLKSGGTMGEATWTLRASQPLDPDRMLRAWRSLRMRHSVLRTVFACLSAEAAIQIILKPSALRSDAFSSVDLPNEEALQVAIKQQAGHHFDLFSPPCGLVVFNVQSYDVVLLKIHHVLYDALTLPNLFKELDLLYRGHALHPLPNVYNCKRRDSTRSRSFWKHSLRDCEQTILRSSLRDVSGFFFAKQVVPGLIRLETKCKEQRISVASPIILAFGSTLARLTSVSNPVMGLFHAGRSALDVSTSLPVLSMSPLCIRDVDKRNILELLEALSDDLGARMPFEQDYLGEIIQDASCHEKPLFNALVNIHIYKHDESCDGEILRQWAPPAKISPSSRMHGRTAVDVLSTEVLTESTFFLDVVFTSCNDSVTLTARCDRQACSEEECKSLLENVASQLNRILESLGSNGGSSDFATSHRM